MNNAEFNRLEKVLSEILKELQIQNKLNALSLIEQYVILDMAGNVVDNIEDINAGVNTLRIYNRETSSTIVKIDTAIVELNLFIAKACIDACNEYSPVLEDIELDNGDENDGD